MALKLPWVHGELSRLSLLVHLIALLALVAPPLPVSRAASVVTHLPGFDGPLPFYLETGYLGVEEETGAELFYYFVESERNPVTDVVLLWLSGGPGCSSLYALLYEIGSDTTIHGDIRRHLHRGIYALISVLFDTIQIPMASILFVDSPVGSGFSYAHDPKGYDVGDISASKKMLTFLQKWFDDHPKYLSNPFYVGGDSYAGKVVPLVAHYISGAKEMQHSHINLKGYIVGNPFTGDNIDQNSRIPSSHSFGIISDQLYEAAQRNCKGDYVNPTDKLCAYVVQIINDLVSEIFEGDILSPVCPLGLPKPGRYASKRKSLAEEQYPLSSPPDEPPFTCFQGYGHYLSYFWANDNATRAALGIKEGTVTEWMRCRSSADLPYTYDLSSSITYHYKLTTMGYRALVYSGDHDLIVPFSGTQAWIRSLNFSIVDDWRAWHLDGQAAGFTITYANNLTFATVKGGSHLPPETQPKESFAMAKRWLDNRSL